MLGLKPEPPEESENENTTSTFVWQQTSGRARRLLGLSALIGLHVTEDVRNTSRNRLVVIYGYSNFIRSNCIVAKLAFHC